MKKLLLALIIAIPATISAQSFVATFPFDSVKNTTGTVDPTPFPVASGVVFDSVRAFNVSANSSASFRFSFSMWPVTTGIGGSTDYAAMTGTVDTSKYYQIGVGPTPGNLLSIDSISFRFQRSGTGVRTYVVRGSEDNYMSNLPAAISPANSKLSVQSGNVFFMNFDSTSGQNGSMIYLFNDTAYAFEDDMSYFRFYAYNAEGNLGTFSIDNLTFYGTVSPGVGIRNNNSTSVLLYPNPTTGLVSLSVKEDRSTINVFDISGKEVMNSIANAGMNRLDLSTLNAGTYIVRIISSEGVSSSRVVKN